MSQYMILAGKGRDGREETYICQSGKKVSASKATFTGLVDSSGKEIFRVQNPIGFHRW